MDQLKKKIQWSNLSLLKVKELHIKYKAAVQITAGMGGPQRPPSTQATLKIIKIKENKKNMKKISFLSFKYNFNCLLVFLSGSSIANLNSLDLPKKYIYVCEIK